MLVKTTKIVLEGKSEHEGKAIKGFRAIIDVDNGCKLTNHPYAIDEAAAKTHRVTVREDQAAFEDYAYEVQESVQAYLKK